MSAEKYCIVSYIEKLIEWYCGDFKITTAIDWVKSCNVDQTHMWIIPNAKVYLCYWPSMRSRLLDIRKRTFFLGTNLVGNPEWQDGPILPTQVANHNTGPFHFARSWIQPYMYSYFTKHWTSEKKAKKSSSQDCKVMWVVQVCCLWAKSYITKLATDFFIIYTKPLIVIT